MHGVYDAQSETEIAPVFAVPLAQATHPDHASLNQELKQLLLQREADPRARNPNPSLAQQPQVFESSFDLFAWKEPCIARLREFCWLQLARVVAQLNGYTGEEMSRIRIHSHTWFHVTRHGGFVITHTHPMASWSGVYCVAPGERAPDRPDSGVLRFHNPHHYSNTFLDPGNARLAAPFHHGTWSVPLRSGQLVIFPSWLSHEVLPFYGGDERITVAFNCWFSMPEAQQ